MLGGISTQCRCVLACLDGHDDGIQGIEHVGVTSIEGFDGRLDLREGEDGGRWGWLATEWSH